MTPDMQIPEAAVLLPGTRVQTHVSVMGKRVPMHVGIVVRDYMDGTVDVDRMSLHGGASWVVREAKSDLEPLYTIKETP